jgi:DNA repair exonuclease SbcCD ATPase subunit
MANHAGEPASYARRVKDDLKKYAQGLLEENARLRSLSAAWQADEQRLRAELASADALCQDVQRLEQHLRVLDDERQRLGEQLANTRATLAAYEQDRDRLARQLAEIHDDNCRYADQYVGLEQDNNNLANLYVITYQLHSTLDRAEVLSSLKEIVTNLVGSEEIALFELNAPRGVLTLIDSNGVQPEVYQQVSAERGLLGRAIRSGRTLIVGPEDRADAESPV